MIVVYTVIVLSILIFVHELGHFGACKISGVKVNEFALGMGPAIFQRQRGETKYALRALPIGGFCAMEGEDGESDDERSFEKKPARIKAFILAAGSIMNIVLAILILSGLILYMGTSFTTQIETVGEGSPAQSAGMLAGDRIIAVDGTATESWEEIVAAISGTEKENISIGIIRAGQGLTIRTDVMAAEDGRKIIGISPHIKHNPFVALSQGTRASYNMLKNMAIILGELFTGNVSAKELTGPVGIAFIVDDTAKNGMDQLLSLVALISLNLAIVNLLPFPALDGGRLLFLGIRKVTGRIISDNMEAKIHFIGLMMLFALMIFVTWNDIERLISGAFN